MELTRDTKQKQREIGVKAICGVTPPPLISKTSKGNRAIIFRKTVNAGRVAGQAVDRLEGIDIVLPHNGNDDSILEILHISRKLSLLLTFLIGSQTRVQPDRFVTINQAGEELRTIRSKLRFKFLPSPNLLDVDLTAPKVSTALSCQNGEMQDDLKLLDYYYASRVTTLLDQVLNLYKIIEYANQQSEKEQTLRHMFSHPRLTWERTVSAAKKYFGSEDLQKADMSKVEVAVEEMEEHAREIISQKLGISSSVLKFYRISRS